jgi:undecaprenyl-diphosphatase
VIGHFIPLVLHVPDNGFPSDHVLLTSAIASIIFPFNRGTSTAAWIVAVLVGVSRVYVGVHHPIDIIGSMVISAIVSTCVYLFLWQKKIKSKPTKS